MQSLTKKLLAVTLSVLPLVGVAQISHDHQEKAAVLKAIAVLSSTKGSSAHGVVTFEVAGNGVRVVANIAGLTPGKHGFHIHEFGDCSSDSGTAAGGHFNPTGMQHGAPSSDNRHAGDLGNIEADKEGNAHLDYVDPLLSLSGENSIIGRGVIVHAKEDDLTTQPTGAAGGRLACGSIGVAKR